MPGWNPSSGVNTLEQTWSAAVSDTRRRIASNLEDLIKKEPDLTPAQIVERIRSGELDAV